MKIQHKSTKFFPFIFTFLYKITKICCKAEKKEMLGLCDREVRHWKHSKQSPFAETRFAAAPCHWVFTRGTASLAWIRSAHVTYISPVSYLIIFSFTRILFLSAPTHSSFWKFGNLFWKFRNIFPKFQNKQYAVINKQRSTGKWNRECGQGNHLLDSSNTQNLPSFFHNVKNFY